MADMTKLMIFAVSAAISLPFASSAAEADQHVPFVDSALVTAMTQGTDRYVDGSVVADGECYALVYVRSGCDFAGFNADGSLVNPEENELVAVAPVAKDGHCPRTLFALKREYVNAHKAGAFDIYLLDTRGADGKPSKLNENGVLGRIRRWGCPKADIHGVTAAETGAEAGEASAAVRLAAVPEGTAQPRITAIKVVDGVVKISVADTAPFLVYGLNGGTSIGKFKKVAKRNLDGDATKEIEFEASADAEGCLYQVVQEQ